MAVPSNASFGEMLEPHEDLTKLYQSVTTALCEAHQIRWTLQQWPDVAQISQANASKLAEMANSLRDSTEDAGERFRQLNAELNRAAQSLGKHSAYGDAISYPGRALAAFGDIEDGQPITPERIIANWPTISSRLMPLHWYSPGGDEFRREQLQPLEFELLRTIDRRAATKPPEKPSWSALESELLGLELAYLKAVAINDGAFISSCFAANNDRVALERYKIAMDAMPAWQPPEVNSAESLLEVCEDAIGKLSDIAKADEMSGTSGKLLKPPTHEAYDPRPLIRAAVATARELSSDAKHMPAMPTGDVPCHDAVVYFGMLNDCLPCDDEPAEVLIITIGKGRESHTLVADGLEPFSIPIENKELWMLFAQRVASGSATEVVPHEEVNCATGAKVVASKATSLARKAIARLNGDIKKWLEMADDAIVSKRKRGYHLSEAYRWRIEDEDLKRQLARREGKSNQSVSTKTPRRCLRWSRWMASPPSASLGKSPAP